MDEPLLRAELEAVRNALPGFRDGSGRRLHLRAAWLLIALGRYSEAARAAVEARQDCPGRTHESVVDTRVAETAAHLARRQWHAAEDAILPAVRLYGDEGPTNYLLELALQGRGTLLPNRAEHWVKHPAEELAAFDPRSYALRWLSQMKPAALPPPPAPRPLPADTRPPAKPFYQTGHALPHEQELHAALGPTLAAADRAGGRDPEQAWPLYVRMAWLLIALERHEEALEAVRAARREFYAFHGVPATPHLAEVLFESGCEAEAVAHLALRNWVLAEDAALRGLADHLGGQLNAPLLKLALVGRGADRPGLTRWQRQFELFDPIQYALHRLQRMRRDAPEHGS